MYDLPTDVEISGKVYKIRNDCDYRVVLDCIEALNDCELEADCRIECALYIFYDNLSGLQDYEEAAIKMMEIINYGKPETDKQNNKPRLMDWQHDFNSIAPPISKVLGYDVRTQKKYTHWWTFLGGYMEIGECNFSNIVSIRRKRAKGQKLDRHELEYYRENRDIIDLPVNITEEERLLLEAEW